MLHYSFFTDHGLTIHDRGISALVRFMGVKSDLFRSIYFHRTVKAIDLTLADLFKESKSYLFDGNPAEDLSSYQGFTESSVLVDVSRWEKSNDLTQRELGKKWRKLLARQYSWHMVCERSLVFAEKDREASNIFSDQTLVESKLRHGLPGDLRDLPLRVDIARHIHRPHTKGPASGQNFLYDSARDIVRPLTTNELFSHAPVSHRI
ncbi:MAG TPA: metal-dependent phosphohydrolase, partial [Pirellulaceae bacterium]|nr:metal-dependent phosphohydrolase [Pirellulaceae bacterium]